MSNVLDIVYTGPKVFLPVNPAALVLQYSPDRSMFDRAMVEKKESR